LEEAAVSSREDERVQELRHWLRALQVVEAQFGDSDGRPVQNVSSSELNSPKSSHARVCIFSPDFILNWTLSNYFGNLLLFCCPFYWLDDCLLLLASCVITLTFSHFCAGFVL
jgi:hypothetical protein